MGLPALDGCFDPARFAVRHLFPTPVVQAALACGPAINAALLPAILSHATATAGVGRSNLGGWQSADDFEAWSGEAGRVLVTAARGLADTLTGVQGEAGLTRTPPVWRVDAWANISGSGHANAAHHHGGAFWSGAYWVDAGDESAGDEGGGGELELLDPRGILPAFASPHLRMALPGCLSAGGSDFLQPETGMLVLFPSWLVHAVRPYRGMRPRVSVAFNFAA